MYRHLISSVVATSVNLGSFNPSASKMFFFAFRCFSGRTHITPDIVSLHNVVDLCALHNTRIVTLRRFNDPRRVFKSDLYNYCERGYEV